MNRVKGFLKKALMVILLSVVTVTALPQSAFTSQASGYSIRINRATNVVTVYNSSGKAVRAMTCSTGGSNTPLGTYSAGQKYRWQVLDGPCYGQYCTRITGHVLFHSVWYYSYDLNSQSTVQYNKLGTPASHGCVRLTVADAKWVYDNIPSGTSITIFDGTEADDPLGKPKTIKVSEATRGGWDPTDPNPDNPYAAYRPTIDVKYVKTEVAYGKKSNYKTAVLAKDSGGGDISDDVKVSGKVNTKKLGTYKVKYTVTDALGHTSKKSIKIKVVDKSKAKITGYTSPLKLEIDTKKNLKEDLTVQTVDGKNLRKSTEVYVRVPDETKYKKLSTSSYTFDVAGIYLVKYRVKNPHNGKITIRRMRVVVTDSGAPVFSGLSSEEEYDIGDDVDLLEDVSAKTHEGEDVSSTILVTVQTPDEEEETPVILGGVCSYTFEEAGTYTVVYTATNPNTGVDVVKKVKYIIYDE